MTGPLMLLPPSALAKAERRAKIRGHAGPPGEGPAGETCGSCRHMVRNEMARTYFKCELQKARWTGGAATDVKARDPACPKWATKDVPVAGDQPPSS